MFFPLRLPEIDAKHESSLPLPPVFLMSPKRYSLLCLKLRCFSLIFSDNLILCHLKMILYLPPLICVAETVQKKALSSLCLNIDNIVNTIKQGIHVPKQLLPGCPKWLLLGPLGSSPAVILQSWGWIFQQIVPIERRNCSCLSLMLLLVYFLQENRKVQVVFPSRLLDAGVSLLHSCFV